MMVAQYVVSVARGSTALPTGTLRLKLLIEAKKDR